MHTDTAKLMRQSLQFVTSDETESASPTWLPTPRRVSRVATPSANRRAPSKRKVKSASARAGDLVSTTINTSTSSVTSKKRHSRIPRGYQGPEHYTYLPASPIRDALAPNLLVLIIGLNPGITTALKGHAYSGPNNHFWRLLYESGITTRQLRPEDDQDLPRLFAIGLTNIVSRPTKGLAQLSKAEMEAAVVGLVAKVRRWRPEVAIMAGKAQYKAFFKVKHGRDPTTEECQYGWVAESNNIGVGTPGVGEHAHEEKEPTVNYNGEWKGARVFIAPSPSGASPMFKGQREAGWRVVGKWVEKRRVETKAAVPVPH